MDFWKGILFLVRKKSVGPPMIVLSIITAGLVYFLLPTVYVSTASMVLTAPATGGTLSQDPTKPGGLTNPLLQFNDGLRTTAGILILAMNAPDVMAELGIADGGPTSLVVNDGRTNPELLGISTNGPFIYVEAESTSAAAARDTTIRAQKRIQAELVERQQALRAPRSTFIWMADVVPPSTPEPKLSATFTAAGGALVVTLLAGFGLAYAVTQTRAGRAAGASRSATARSAVPTVPPVPPVAPVPAVPAPHAEDAVSDADPAPAQAASLAEAPTTDMAAPAPGAVDEAGVAGESDAEREPSRPVVTTVIRRSEWPEFVSDEPGTATSRQIGASAEPDAVGDEAEPVSAGRASGDPEEGEEETAAWSDDDTRELRTRLTGENGHVDGHVDGHENGHVDGRDGSAPASASPAEDSYVVVVPGRADRDDSRGGA